jgi:molecular chaperone DnaK
VAIGAAIQGAVLTGEVKDLILLDVTPLSLGIETMGGVFTRIIGRNTTIPTRESQIFSTAEDNQTAVAIHVLQGEREMAKDNKSLGKFELVGIPPAPRGVPQIEVTFDIDANGIVGVSAKDMGTGKEQAIRITGASGLTEDEIQIKIRDAQQYAEEDRRRREFAEVQNQAEALVYSTQKSLQEFSGELSEFARDDIRDAIRDTKDAIETKDLAELKTALQGLRKAAQKLTEVIYASSKSLAKRKAGSAGS